VEFLLEDDNGVDSEGLGEIMLDTHIREIVPGSE
jgi:hypothetical protein